MESVRKKEGAFMTWGRLGMVTVMTLALEAASAFTAEQSLDYDFFKSSVEPIFLKKREGHGRCYVCHAESNNAFRLEKLSPGSTSWTEEQSRRNFTTVSNLVTPNDPLSSPLLLRPLAPEAGGNPFHSGGRQFSSKNDPDWKTVAEWASGKK